MTQDLLIFCNKVRIIGVYCKHVAYVVIVFKKIQKQNFDIILLDWMLKKMSGLELCKAICLKTILRVLFF